MTADARRGSRLHMFSVKDAFFLRCYSNVFFTAIFLVALGRFIKGADILADLPQV